MKRSDIPAASASTAARWARYATTEFQNPRHRKSLRVFTDPRLVRSRAVPCAWCPRGTASPSRCAFPAIRAASHSASIPDEQCVHECSVERGIAALQLLNRLGYGRRPELPLHLIYNRNGANLPGPQEELETDYKRELAGHFGIVFNNLFTITNLPIARFASWLRHEGKYEEYMATIVAAFNPATVDGLMCRNTINVSWEGEAHDRDFNQMLRLPLAGNGRRYVWDLNPAALAGREIATGHHCFGCTAGAGSSCGGALT